jgi:hypothetical protein
MTEGLPRRPSWDSLPTEGGEPQIQGDHYGLVSTAECDPSTTARELRSGIITIYVNMLRPLYKVRLAMIRELFMFLWWSISYMILQVRVRSPFQEEDHDFKVTIPVC